MIAEVGDVIKSVARSRENVNKNTEKKGKFFFGNVVEKKWRTLPSNNAHRQIMIVSE